MAAIRGRGPRGGGSASVGRITRGSGKGWLFPRDDAAGSPCASSPRARAGGPEAQSTRPAATAAPPALRIARRVGVRPRPGLMLIARAPPGRETLLPVAGKSAEWVMVIGSWEPAPA